jgi:hypothetical protein
MDSDVRRNEIIDFVAKHQGCTAQNIVDGVEDQMSRTLVFSTLKGLIQDCIVEDNKLNRRNHRYFVNTSNLLLSVTQELNELETRILRWIKSVKERYESQIALARKTNLHPDYARAEEIDILAQHASKIIVTQAVNIYTTYALSDWPKKSNDREFLNKLYATVFSKLHNIVLRLAKILPFSERLGPDTVERIREFPRYRIDVEEFQYIWENVRKHRLDTTEFEDLMDSLWKISDIFIGTYDEKDEPTEVTPFVHRWKDVFENPDKYY